MSPVKYIIAMISLSTNLTRTPFSPTYPPPPSCLSPVHGLHPQALCDPCPQMDDSGSVEAATLSADTSAGAGPAHVGSPASSSPPRRTLPAPPTPLKRHVHFAATVDVAPADGGGTAELERMAIAEGQLEHLENLVYNPDEVRCCSRLSICYFHDS